MSKFKKGDIVKVTKIIRYEGANDTTIKAWKRDYLNTIWRISFKRWDDKRRYYSYEIGNSFIFLARELTLATEREIFLYYINGPDCLREKNE